MLRAIAGPFAYQAIASLVDYRFLACIGWSVVQQVVHIAAFACVPAYTASIVSFHKATLCMLNSSPPAPCEMSLKTAAKL